MNILCRETRGNRVFLQEIFVNYYDLFVACKICRIQIKPLLSTIQRKEGVRKWFVRISPKSVMLRKSMVSARECQPRMVARFSPVAEQKAERNCHIDLVIKMYCEVGLAIDLLSAGASA